MRVLMPLTILALALSNLACAHAVRIESAPGAEIFVNGQSVGTSPATYQETTGGDDTVQVTARLRGREKTVSVKRSDVDMMPVGAGAAAGAAGCMAASAATLVTAFIFPPCVLLTGSLAWGSLLSGPLAGWIWFGHKMPDTVRVDLESPPPAVAMNEEQRH